MYQAEVAYKWHMRNLLSITIKPVNNFDILKLIPKSLTWLITTTMFQCHDNDTIQQLALSL